MAPCEILSRDLAGSPWLHIDSNLPMEIIQSQTDGWMMYAMNPTYTKGL